MLIIESQHNLIEILTFIINIFIAIYILYIIIKILNNL